MNFRLAMLIAIGPLGSHAHWIMRTIARHNRRVCDRLRGGTAGRKFAACPQCKVTRLVGNLAIEISDGMPDDLLGNLMFFLNVGDQDLLEGLAKDRSYASGARYLLELMRRRASDSRTLEQSRRNG